MVRLVVALALGLLLAAAGCGGGKKTTFTNENYQTLIDHPGKYAGARVDVVGQAQQVVTDEQGVEWLLVYVDVRHASWVTLVDVPDASSAIGERQLVHVVGTVKQGLSVPFDFGGYESAPVVLADKATAATSTTG
jgi:hypothetical protein